MKVPFLDLKAQSESIKQEVNPAIQRVLDTSAFAGGPFVKSFEKEWASFCGCEHAVGVGSGTDALWLVLLAGTCISVSLTDHMLGRLTTYFPQTPKLLGLVCTSPALLYALQLTLTSPPV